MSIWSQQEIEILKLHYGKIKKEELLKFLPGRSLKGIAWQAQKHRLVANRSITNKHTSVNEDFFRDINPVTCYYAGLIAADGCIAKDRNSFTLHQKDIEVLGKFKNNISYTGIISRRQISGKEDNYCHSINITSRKLVNDLEIFFNIIPKKSLILKPPSNLDYFHSLCFILGYIDGDGYISIVKTKRQNPYMLIGALGTKETCYWIKSVLGVGRVDIRKDSKNIIYRYNCSHSKAFQLIGVFREIYQLKDIRINRKWDKYNEFKQSYQN